MKKQPNEVKKLVRKIVKTVHPQKVILFGSRARGTEDEDSDIDLMVVMPNGVQRGKITRKLYSTIRGIGIPYDLLVATPDDLERYRHNPALVYRWALEEGREVYAG